MGGLVINPEIRCLACFHIYSIQISPNFPKCLLLETCKCGTKSVDLSVFLPEYRKNKKLIIYCFKCDKKNIKDASYCVECKKLYCSKCLKNEHLIQNPNNIHRYIPIDKYDFFCINHQTENFCAYCKTCKEDICNMCVQSKLHDGHNVLFYNKMYNEKKMEEFYKKAVKAAEAKIEYNKIICNMIAKKFNKNDVKTLKALNLISENENKMILETLNIFHEIYGSCKNKNNALISNLIDNMDFNLEKIKFEKNTTKDKDLQDLSNYFKTDFILKVKVKKEQIKENENQEEKEGDKKESEEKKEGDAPPSEEKKEGEVPNPEEKKEGEVPNQEEKKEGDVPNPEEKKEGEAPQEEKKEEEIQAEEKRDEIKEEEKDEGEINPIKKMKKLLEKKIDSQGGFKKVDNVPNSSNERNDIINEPKGNPENVVNIIQNQKINTKNKKKPRKINFDS
jgi:hypothetical protein